LGVDAFADLDRLHFDVACAQALRARFGCEAATGEWLRAELRAAGSSTRDRSAPGPGPRVRGVKLAVPFLLSSVELASLSVRKAGGSNRECTAAAFDEGQLPDACRIKSVWLVGCRVHGSVGRRDGNCTH